MARIVVYDPSDGLVSNNVTQFLPSGHPPDFNGVPDVLINPDLSALWTPASGFIVPERYWKFQAPSSIVEMSPAEQTIIDTLPSEVFEQTIVSGDGSMDSMIVVGRGVSTDATIKFNESTQGWEVGLRGAEVPIMRPTYCIWAEENSNVSTSNNNYEYSFGNGATNNSADPPGIPIGVNSTLIGIGVSARVTNTSAASVSISVTNNGVVVGTSGIASVNAGASNRKVQEYTPIQPDTVNFSPGDTVQFLTASNSGGLDDVKVVAWFERTS